MTWHKNLLLVAQHFLIRKHHYDIKFSKKNNDDDWIELNNACMWDRLFLWLLSFDYDYWTGQTNMSETPRVTVRSNRNHKIRKNTSCSTEI